GEGQFLVRWVPDFSFEYGRPLFNFYSPSFYYLTCAIAFSGIGIVTAFNYSFIFLWIASGLTMYLFTKEFFGKYGGFIAAIAYVYAPYHIVDVYVRGAAAEFTAFPLFPLILWSFYKQSKKPNLLYIVSGAVSLGLLLLSHNIMALIFTPLAFVYILFLFWINQKNNIKALFYNGMSFALGILLSAFFWLPAMVEKKFVRVGDMVSGYYSYKNHFVYLQQLFYSKWGYGLSVEGTADDMSFQIGFVHIFMAAAVLFLIQRFLKKSKTISAHVIFFLGVGFITIFFTTAMSSPFWKLFPILRFVQFPWRFLSLVILALSFLCGSLFFIIENKNYKRIALAVVTLLIVLTNIFLCKPDIHYDQTSNATNLRLNGRRNRKTAVAARIYGDYIPIWVRAVPKPLTPQELSVSSGDATIIDSEHKPVEHHFTVEANKDSILRFHTFYFPGWKVFVDGFETPINPVSANGLMDFAVPKGRHQIRIEFTNTPLRANAVWISLFTLLVLVFLLTAKWTALKGEPPDANLLQDAPEEPAQNLAPRSSGLMAWMPPACLFFISLTVYLKTLCPSVYGGNSGEIISSAATLGISHPTGFPLYMLAAKLFSVLLPFGDIAFRLNIFSAFFAALTIIVIYFILKILTNREFISIGGALSLAFSSTFWSNAIVARTYSMTGFFIALLIYLLMIWRLKREDKYLYLLSIVLSLGLATHAAMLLMIPMAIILVAMTDAKTLTRPAAFKAYVLTFCITIILYLYIPLQAASGSSVNWGNPVNLKGFLNYITAHEYLTKMPPGSISLSLKVFFTSIRLFILDFTPVGFIVIITGISVAAKKNKEILTALSLIILGNVLFLTNYGNKELLSSLSLYLFPSYIALSVFAGLGLHRVLDLVEPKIKDPVFSSLILMILPLACVITHFNANNQSSNFSALDYAENILKTVPSNSLLISKNDNVTGPLQYVQTVKEPDNGVIVINSEKITRNHYCRNLIKHHPKIISEDILSIPAKERMAHLINTNISSARLYATFPLSKEYESIPYGLVYKISAKNALPDSAQIIKTNRALWKDYTERGLPIPHDNEDPVRMYISEEYAKSKSTLGQYYYNTGLVEDARKAYEEALKYNPENFFGLLHLGQLLLESGDFEGERLIKKAEDVNPDYYLASIPIGGEPLSEEMMKVVSHVQAGDNSAGLGYFKEAIEDYKLALELKPDDASIYIQLGHAHINLNDMNAAFDMYQKAITLNPGSDSIFAYLNIGAIYMNTRHDYPNAIIYFEKYLKLASEGHQSIQTKKKVEQIKTILLQLKNNVTTNRHQPRFSN
ncbi:DUF2723 domain-containing protein, partial [Candidatus Pacearchaeota archaeon]|nr:DUF2723 domain-containing protein [Candidatus Pacearchaeota archaeon]